MNITRASQRGNPGSPLYTALTTVFTVPMLILVAALCLLTMDAWPLLIIPIYIYITFKVY